MKASFNRLVLAAVTAIAASMALAPLADAAGGGGRGGGGVVRRRHRRRLAAVVRGPVVGAGATGKLRR